LKRALAIFILLIVLSSGFVIIASINSCTVKILDIGTFVVIALTLVVLMIYAYDTNRMASITQSVWQRESVLNTTYTMEGINDVGGAGRILFQIHNPSTLIIRAKVWCEFKVYGSRVISTDDLNGNNTWICFPNQMSQGWYEIASLIAQQGKTVQQMIAEYNDNNRSRQLTLECTVEFRDELGNRRRLPTRRSYFAFNDWRWIPVFTETGDW
jgi:hypothetical protein